jgi:very-short-patch-repair endonuclease
MAFPGISPIPEITVREPQRVALPGLEVHRAIRLDDVDRDRVDGIPVTSLTLTIINLAEVLDGRDLARVLDHVLAKRRVPLGYICARLESLGTRGRKGTGTLKELLAERKGRRVADSEFQRLLEKVLADAELRVLVEYPIRLPDGTMRYVDGAFPDQALAIEADSYEHHSSLPAWAYAHTRNSELIALGWRVLPITYDRLTSDPVGVVDLVVRALAGDLRKRSVARRRSTAEGPATAGS